MAVTSPPTDAEGGPTIYQPLDSEVRSALDPEFVSFYDKYMQYVEPDDVRPWDAIKTRKRVPFPSGTSQLVEVCQIKDFELDNFPIRVFWACGERPASGWPVLVWYHGGGWAIGSIESENDFCTRMCRGTCAENGLESPFPTPRQGLNS
jgi:acetyl esterase/lipase